MVNTLLPNGRQQFIDSNGQPLIGGFVYMYQPGTTIFQTTYQNAGGTVVNSNPIVLDDLGSALIYGTGQYRQIVKDSLGNLIWDDLTQDLYSLILDADPAAFTSITTADLVVTSIAQVPTANPGTNDTTAANTKFVQAAINSIPAVTFQNKIRNPGMYVQQRGSSGTITAGTPSYTVDGFIVGTTGSNANWGTGTNVFGVGSSLVLFSAIGLTDIFVKQRIEGSIAATMIYASSSTVTFQVSVFNSTGVTITPTLTVNVANALDNWSSSSPILSAVALQPCPTSTSTVVCYTFNVGASVANGVEIIVDFGSSLNSSGGITVNVGNFDFRPTPSVTLGLNSSPPIPELRIYPFELLYCQRYYYRIVFSANQIIGYGFSTANNNWEIGIQLPLSMRVIPNPIFPTAASVQANFQTALTLVTSNGNAPSITLYTVSGTVASGITANNGVALRWASTGSGNIQFSSEL